MLLPRFRGGALAHWDGIAGLSLRLGQPSFDSHTLCLFSFALNLCFLFFRQLAFFLGQFLHGRDFDFFRINIFNPTRTLLVHRRLHNATIPAPPIPAQ